MRKLIILQGPSASGKTSWLKKHSLMPYAISADKIRESLGYRNVTGVSDNNTKLMTIMTDQQEKPVWDIFNRFLEKRMANGITTIVDNTDTNFMVLRPLRKMAKKYNYDIQVIDFMLDLLPRKKTELTKKYPEFEYQPDFAKSAIDKAMDILLKRNDQRGEYRVPDHVIRQQVNQYHEFWKRVTQHPDDWKWAGGIAPDSPRVKRLFFGAMSQLICLNIRKFRSSAISTTIIPL